MQGQAHHQRIGKGVGDRVKIQQGGHLGLAPDAVQAFGDVENQIPAVAGGQPCDQLARIADAFGFMARLAQSVLKGVDGVLAVELGGLILAVPLGKVGGPQVVCHSDQHFFSMLPQRTVASG